MCGRVTKGGNVQCGVVSWLHHCRRRQRPLHAPHCSSAQSITSVGTPHPSSVSQQLIRQREACVPAIVRCDKPCVSCQLLLQQRLQANQGMGALWRISRCCGLLSWLRAHEVS
jgi:hypothetical protein